MTEAAAPMRTASLPTVPESVDGRAQETSSFERAEAQHGAPRWAVDNGNAITAMTTFELWLALDSGEISPSALVWRVGREAWDPVLDVPELACALRDSLVGGRERKTLDYPIREQSLEVEERSPSPVASAPARLEQLDSLSSNESIEELDLEPDPSVMPPDVIDSSDVEHAVVQSPAPPVNAASIEAPPKSAGFERVVSVERSVRRRAPRSWARAATAVTVGALALAAGVGLAAAPRVMSPIACRQ
ncbi:MAG: hypothetical protein U0271_21605 [Polyangiaceae bacterium]